MIIQIPVLNFWKWFVLTAGKAFYYPTGF